ncbi:hypothetical protein H4O20_08715 [Aequorivita sp. 609]|uniref:sulfotransferase n=1 Tax=Aequorivita TaxID=153265 RepID=UPI00160846E3|nr:MULTISPECIES: sulfotransferase [Aequorivita]MBB6681523.1 hypothetical protein [Aequorivita sp. 609]
MFEKVFRKVFRIVYVLKKSQPYSKRNKVFCIGANKTGTTSMKEIFRTLEIPVGSQLIGEMLVSDVVNKNYYEFIKYVKYGGVGFQDLPFSLPEVFKILDKKFPESKFILTLRDSPEVWYNSLINFHAKVFGNGKLPTKSDLQNNKYVYKGWAWEINRLLFDTPEDDLYNKEILIQSYINYNNSVIEYFKSQPEKLLVINLKEPDAAKKISQFLDSEIALKEIPWENKT